MLVSQPIEEAVNTVEGIDELRSVSVRGVLVRHRHVPTRSRHRGRDAGRPRPRLGSHHPAARATSGRRSSAKRTTTSRRCSPSPSPANRPLRELTEIADKIIKPYLERAPGVGERRDRRRPRARDQRLGGRRPAGRLPAPDHRGARRPRPPERRPARRQRHRRASASRRCARWAASSIRGRSTIWSSRRATASRSASATSAGPRTAPRNSGSLSRLNGVPTVTLAIRRQSGANTVAVIEGVKASLERVRGQMPPDVELEVIRDQSRYIYAALHEINLHLVLGSILACLVVFAFMRNWRATIIAGVAIPASVIATFGMMAALDFTLNSVTMLALVLMVGIVIDDAIVVLENIFRFVEEKQMGAVRGGEGGDRGDRAAGAGDDAEPRGHLHSRLVHVEHLGALPLSVRHHGGRGDHGQPARVVHAHADDERAAAAVGAEEAPRSRTTDAARESRGGFYGYIDRAYTAMLSLVDARTACVIAGVAAVVALSRRSRSTRWCGRSSCRAASTRASSRSTSRRRRAPASAAMNEVMATVEKRDPGGARRGAGAGQRRRWLPGGRSTRARFTCASRRTRSACSHWARLVQGLVTLDPLEAFRGNYSQRRGDAAGSRGACGKFGDLRDVRSATSSRSVSAADPPSSTSRMRGPELEALAEYTEKLRVKRPGSRHRRRRHHAEVEQAGAAGADRSRARRRSGRRHAGHRLGAARDGRRRRRGHALPRRGDQRRLRRAVAADRAATATIRRPLGQLYVPRRQRRARAARQPRADRLQTESPSRIDRIDRQRQANLRAGVGPGFAQADRMQALRRPRSS